MRLAGGLAADDEVPLLVLQALPWEEGVSKGMQAPLCSFVEAFFLDGSNEAVGGAFLRLSSSPGLETLRNGLALFLHGTFQKRILRAPERQQRLLLGRYKAALSGLNDELTRLQTRASSLENKQNSILGKVNTAREIQDLSTQKLDALARKHAALYDDLTETMARVDSLYYKAFKKYKPQSP